MGDVGEEKESAASGDNSETKKPEIYTPPEPEPKPPDVELFVDGFGFMPKSKHKKERRRSSVFEKTKLPQQESYDDHSEQSFCITQGQHLMVFLGSLREPSIMFRIFARRVITYGATITSISVPDKKGVPDDVLAGFDTLEEYFQPGNPYFGATIGRYANVIRDGTFVVRPSGRMYMVSNNKGHNHYNGGYVGFDKVNWRSYVSGLKVIMSHVSERFHEGYPGTVMCQITFEVTCNNTLKIEMKCTTSEPTVINLSNAPFFNLAGHHTGAELMLDHIFTINADKFTAVDEDGLVTGERKVVGGTAYDFRVPRILRSMLPKIPMGGYDINYCITRGTEQDLAFQARVLHPLTGRVLEVYSNQPGMQFYTGNLLPDPDRIVEPVPMSEEEREEVDHSEEMSSESSSVEVEDEEGDEREGKKGYGYVPLLGKKGTMYKRHGLFCLMPQNYPDAVNYVSLTFQSW
ncbi:unnamed protein product [Spodoptera exigua]|nr:unnamed protein product [Spodoptera exigua]